MALKRCIACGDTFRSRPQVPNQAYCSAAECQHERRRLWQRDKRVTDEDYRDNQSRAHKKWLMNQMDYWQRYRAEHPGYAEDNRTKQRARNAKHSGAIAKMDLSAPVSALPSGLYELRRHRRDDVANMDVWIVQIIVLSTT